MSIQTSLLHIPRKVLKGLLIKHKLSSVSSEKMGSTTTMAKPNEVATKLKYHAKEEYIHIGQFQSLQHNKSQNQDTSASRSNSVEMDVLQLHQNSQVPKAVC